MNKKQSPDQRNTTQYLGRTLQFFPIVRRLEYTISHAHEGKKVEVFLRQQGFSTENCKLLKKYFGTLFLNGKPVFINERLHAGDLLEVNLPEEASSSIAPVCLPLDIVYEDRDLLIINKPAGMPCHPSRNNYDNTLANALAFYFQEKGEPFVFRCITRLDRDTSGLCVVARNVYSAAVLAEELKVGHAGSTAGGTVAATAPFGERKDTVPPIFDTLQDDSRASGDFSQEITKEYCSPSLTREYLAICSGSVTPEEGTVCAPLGRKPGSVIERTIDFENGEEAITHYKKIAEKNGHSLVALQLQTGRTHQIRIHMKYLGFPLVGDYLYNPDYRYMKRQALHSHRVTLMHPVTKEQMTFTAPLPEDMAALFPDMFLSACKY